MMRKSLISPHLKLSPNTNSLLRLLTVLFPPSTYTFVCVFYTIAEMGFLRMLIVFFVMYIYIYTYTCDEAKNGYFWIFLFLGFYGLIVCFMRI